MNTITKKPGCIYARLVSIRNRVKVWYGFLPHLWRREKSPDNLFREPQRELARIDYAERLRPGL